MSENIRYRPEEDPPPFQYVTDNVEGKNSPRQYPLYTIQEGESFSSFLCIHSTLAGEKSLSLSGA